MLRGKGLANFAWQLFGLWALVGCTKTSAPEFSNAEPSLEAQIEACQKGLTSELVVRRAISEGEFKAIAAIKGLETLEMYDTSRIGSSLATNIAGLKRLKRLRLEGSPIDDEDMLAIAGLKSLEVLNLPNGVFTDVATASIAGLPKLWLLRFRSVNVSDVGVSALAKASSLRFLHLLDVPITDAGLAAFHHMDQLESLYIDGGQETESGIVALLKANPKLHFHRNQLHIDDDPNADDH